MRNAKSKTAVLVAVLIMAVVGALSWVLLISPQIESASDLRKETEAVENKNDIDRARVATLRDQNDRLPEFKAEIAEYQIGIPTDPNVAEFYDFVFERATETGVFLADLGTLDGETVKAENEPALPPTLADQRQAEREAADQAAAEAAAAVGDPAPPKTEIPLITDFYSIETHISVIGPRDDVFEFLRQIQLEASRHHLVSGYTVISEEEAEASGGMPEIEEGFISLDITGHIYLLRDPSKPNVKDPEAVIPPLPAPNENNPFLPLPPGMDGNAPIGSNEGEE